MENQVTFFMRSYLSIIYFLISEGFSHHYNRVESKQVVVEWVRRYFKMIFKLK